MLQQMIRGSVFKKPNNHQSHPPDHELAILPSDNTIDSGSGSSIQAQQALPDTTFLRFRRLSRAPTQMIEEYGATGAISVMTGFTFWSLFGAITYLLICFGLGISSIVIGAIYFRDCSGQHNLPVMLVIVAVFATITTGSDTVTLFKKYQKRRQDDQLKREAELNPPVEPDPETTAGAAEDEDQDLKLPEISIVISGCRLAHFGLFIYLSVLVFQICMTVQYKNSASSSNRPYCSEILFKFSFWYVIVNFAELGIVFLMIVSCCCCCCCCCGHCECHGKKRRSRGAGESGDSNQNNLTVDVVYNK